MPSNRVQHHATNAPATAGAGGTGEPTGTCGLCGMRPTYDNRRACPVCRRVLSTIDDLGRLAKPEGEAR